MREEQGGGGVCLRAFTRMCTPRLKCGCMESVHTITVPDSQANALAPSQLCSLSITLSEVGFTWPEVHYAWKRGNAER